MSLGSKCTMYNFATILSRLSNDAVSTNTSVCPFWSYLSYLSFTYICTYNRITQNTLSTHSGCREPFNTQNRVARYIQSTHLSLAERCLIILYYALLVHSLVWISSWLMVKNGQWVLILCANKIKRDRFLFHNFSNILAYTSLNQKGFKFWLKKGGCI